MCKIYSKFMVLMTAIVSALTPKKVEKKESNKLFLPLNLQFFAEEGDDDGGSGDGEGNDDDPGDDEGDDQTGKVKAKAKTFSQEDVNAIAAKEAKKAQERLFKDLGVKDAKSAKEGLAKFKEMQDNQKTDAQKAADRVKELEEQNGGYTGKMKALEAQVSAMKAGVNNDSLDDVITLANNLVNDDTSMDEAITAVLTKYPNFKATKEADKADDEQTDKDKKKKPKFTNGEHNGDKKVSDADLWNNAFAYGAVKS